jgi:hypothetical protein
MDRRVVAQLYDCVDQIKNVREAAVSILDTNASAPPPPPLASSEGDALVSPDAPDASEPDGGLLASDRPLVVPVVSRPNFVVLIATTNRCEILNDFYLLLPCESNITLVLS